MEVQGIAHQHVNVIQAAHHGERNIMVCLQVFL